MISPEHRGQLGVRQQRSPGKQKTLNQEAREVKVMELSKSPNKFCKNKNSQQSDMGDFFVVESSFLHNALENILPLMP